MRFIVALLCAILLWPAGLVEAADKGLADVATGHSCDLADQKDKR